MASTNPAAGRDGHHWQPPLLHLLQRRRRQRRRPGRRHHAHRGLRQRRLGSFHPGQVITDADPITAGNQTGVFGVNAFSSIRLGVNAVASSGTVDVFAGTYKENPTINKPLTLLGANAGLSGSGVRGSESVIVTNGNQNAVVTLQRPHTSPSTASPSTAMTPPSRAALLPAAMTPMSCTAFGRLRITATKRFRTTSSKRHSSVSVGTAKRAAA